MTAQVNRSAVAVLLEGPLKQEREREHIWEHNARAAPWRSTFAASLPLQAAVPLVYIPLEAVVSKWYGESEKMLAGGRRMLGAPHGGP